MRRGRLIAAAPARVTPPLAFATLTFAALVLAALALLLAAAPALSSAPEAEIDHLREYQACMTLAREQPEEARRSGLAWHRLGGGFAARHCVATALLHSRQYDEAAARLEKLARDLGTARTSLLTGIMMQAGQAWYLAGRVEKALGIQSNLLDLAPGDPQLWLDRAVSLMDLHRYAAALGDLDEAIRRGPEVAEARLYRVVALRELDRLEEAWTEVETVLALFPDHGEALLERGILRQYRGDLDGARADWLRVIDNDPASPPADAARARIEEMDVIAR